MKWVTGLGVLALVLVGSLAIYADYFLDDVKEAREKLDSDEKGAVTALEELDQTHAFDETKPPGKKRVEAWLEMHAALTGHFERRAKNEAAGSWHFDRTTTIMALQRLAAEMRAHKMSVREYRAIRRCAGKPPTPIDAHPAIAD